MSNPDAEPHFATTGGALQPGGGEPCCGRRPRQGNGLLDIRPLLPSIRVPTLVLNRSGDPVGPAAAGRYMAGRIPGARFVELDGDEHILWLGDSEALCGEIEGFVTGIRPHMPEPGVVRAILQSDIEGSTLLANDLGNERWADLLLEYGSMAGKVIAGYGGRIVDQIGDGLMAEFEGPVNAIRAAQRLRTTAAEIGIAVRSGIHVGEVVDRDGALRGIAVHVSARVMAKGGGGAILVSQTTKDICGGSGLEFTESGSLEPDPGLVADPPRH
jgi:hypothetical protein